MKLTTGGKALISVFASAIIGLGVLSSLRATPEPIRVDPVPVPTPVEPDLGVIRATLIRSAGEVESLDAQIAAVESALEIARAEGKARIISRQDDRDRVAALNEQVVGLKTKRAQAVRNYEADVAGADSRAVTGLPTFKQSVGP